MAFVNRKGAALLEDELSELGSRCRLVATTAFGQSTEAAFTRLHSYRTVVTVLSPATGTYHPKRFLTRAGRRRTAVVGSANLTSGLLGNIEIGALLSDGGPFEGGQADAAWELGEALWEHREPRRWDPAVPLPAETLDPTLLNMIRDDAPSRLFRRDDRCGAPQRDRRRQRVRGLRHHGPIHRAGEWSSTRRGLDAGPSLGDAH